MLNILRFLFSSPTKACFLPHQSPLAFCCQEKSLQAGCSKGERKGKEARGGTFPPSLSIFGRAGNQSFMEMDSLASWHTETERKGAAAGERRGKV